MPERFEVIIVGGGPVGAALAVDLGLRGVRCALIERRTGLSLLPKGQSLSQRTMEHFHFWGIADELRAARTMTRGYPIGQVTVYKNLLTGHWDAQEGREVVNPYYYERSERLPQYRTEEVLRKRMAGLPSVRSYFGFQATNLSQDAYGVQVRIEGDGTAQTLTGDYLVGCDGGGALVRESADIEREGTNFSEVMALVIFRSPELHQILTKFPPRTTYRVLHPELNGYWMFFGRVDDDESFFFHAPIPRPHNTDNVDIAAMLAMAAGTEFNFKIDHLGFWDLRVQIAEKYRAGRVFIAGDAAHTHPPYGGFGLNNGLEDITNLGWKLPSVLQGCGTDELLDSYSEERQPIFHDVGEAIIAGSIREEREFFAHAAQHATAGNSARCSNTSPPDWAGGTGPMSRTTTPLRSSPPRQAPARAPWGVHELAARTGHHLAAQALSTGANVYTELGPWFTLLDLDPSSAEGERFQAESKALGIPMKIIRDGGAALRDAYQAARILVRPDQFIAWTSNEAEQDPVGVLSIATGRSPRL